MFKKIFIETSTNALKLAAAVIVANVLNTEVRNLTNQTLSGIVQNIRQVRNSFEQRKASKAA
jgi:hypothetical protein